MISPEETTQTINDCMHLHTASLEQNDFYPKLKHIENMTKQVRELCKTDLSWDEILEDSEPFLIKDLFNILYLDFFEELNKKKQVSKKEIKIKRVFFNVEIKEFINDRSGYRQNLRLVTKGDAKIIYRYSKAHNEIDAISLIVPDNSLPHSKLFFFMTGNETFISHVENKNILHTTLKEEFHMKDTTGDHYNLFSRKFINGQESFTSFVKGENTPFQKSSFNEKENSPAILKIENSDDSLEFYGIEGHHLLENNCIVFCKNNKKIDRYSYQFNGSFEHWTCLLNDSVYDVLDSIMDTKLSYKNSGNRSPFAVYSIEEKKYLKEALELLELNLSY